MKVSADLSQVPPEIARTGTPKEMLSVDETGRKPKVRINSSSLSVIHSCPRKAYYTLHRKLKARHEAPATLFGLAIHKALEIFYSEPRGNRSIPSNFREQADLLAYGHTPPSDHFLFRAIAAFVNTAEPLRALPETDKRSLGSGVWLLRNYFESYINDPFEVLCDQNGPITERSFSMPLYEDEELEIEYFGQIDVVLKNAQTHVILPTDHKTSSIVGSDFYNRLKPNHQYTGYLLAAQRILGLDTDSFLVNCLQVKPKPLTARGGPPQFPRQVTKRDAGDIQEFIDSVVCAVRNYLTWRAEDKWPLGDVNACTMYGGCSFLDVDAAPIGLRENIIDSKFISEV